MAPAHRSLCLLLNARAASDQRLREAVYACREAGHGVEVRPLWEPGQAEQFAAEATARGTFDAIVAAGGDGTLNEVVNGVMAAAPDDPPAVGVLPYGTANDFALGLGMPDNPPADGLQGIVTATPRRIDLGQLNDRWFINALSVGLNAEITADTPGPLKRLLGGAAYSLNAVGKLADDAHRPARITADSFNWEGDLLMLIVANARTAGGGYNIAPDAELDDGLLDATVVANAPAGELAELLANLFATAGRPDHSAVTRQRVRQLDLETEQPVTLNLDGESLSQQRCRCVVHARALPVLMPARVA